jgi:hypothetical protein
MNTFKLLQTEEGDIYFNNLSPMYPTTFEKRINELAGEEITKHAKPIGGLFGNFINTFVIKSEKKNIFTSKVFPNISSKKEDGAIFVWDNEEESEGNNI